MKVVELGSGPPIVVIPGVQGRWEWMRPGIDALAERCRVITFSLCDEPCSEGSFNAESGFDCYVEQVRDALDQAGVHDAAICGVSYGGLIASAFAARYPERTRSLILIAALSPSWTPDARVRFYLRAPRLLAPVFWVRSPFVLYPEIVTAVPDLAERVRVSAAHLRRVLTHPTAPTRMSRRVELLGRARLQDRIAKITSPTLIVTGEPALDLVVPPRVTLEYTKLIPHAVVSTLSRTGHIGFVTRPHALAGVVGPFVEQHSARTQRRAG